MPNYIPEKGDFITLSFDPQSGHEQKGRRPALVISNFLFNKATGWRLFARLQIQIAEFHFICSCRVRLR